MPRVGITVIAPVAPVTGKVLRQHYRSAPPEDSAIVTPARARELHGTMGSRRSAQQTVPDAGGATLTM
jgi:hypothetical protein